MFVDRKNVFKTFKLMNDNNVDYVLIKNNSNYLPDELPAFEKDIDMIIKPDSFEIARHLLYKNGFVERAHPYGYDEGYTCLYGMKQPLFITHKNGICLDISGELCCKTIQGKMWIPLDRAIQKSIWKNKYFDSSLQCWRMDDKNLFVYLVVREVFDKGGFDPKYKTEIEKRIDLIQDNDVISKLNLVFFKFTEKLINLISQKQFDLILPSYISFDEY